MGTRDGRRELARMSSSDGKWMLGVALATMLLGGGLWWVGQQLSAPGATGLRSSHLRAVPGNPGQAIDPRRPHAAGSRRTAPQAPPDGRLQADAAGQLQVDADTRRLFDHFLVALTDDSLDAELGRIKDYVQRELPAVAAAQAMDLLGRYVACEIETSTLNQAAGLPGADTEAELSRLTSLLRERRRVRLRHLGPLTAAIFYDEQERLDQYGIDRLRVMSDPALDDHQREERLALLERRAEIDARQAAERMRSYQRLQADIAALRAAGAPEAAVATLRVQTLGVEEAAQLDEWERRQQAWEERYRVYREALDGLNVPPHEHAAAADTLRAQYFPASDLWRVRYRDAL